MKTEVLPADSPEALPHALEVLKRGGVAAFPTDTVYGIGAMVFDAEAVARLYAAKGRPPEKAVPVLVGQTGDVSKVAAKFTPSAKKLAAAFWPGALTLVLPKLPVVPEIVSAYPTIGVRLPDHAVARALLTLAGPLAVTSANLSGMNSHLHARAVLADLNGRIDLLIDGGPCPGGVPSTVLDCTVEPPEMLRVGPISFEAIVAVLEI
jgi:L-threonylcarbamoyladenylate synthase